MSVIGLGYIGLRSAAMFVSRQIEVIRVNVNADVIATINQGAIHFVETDLDILVYSAVKEGNLRPNLTPPPAEAFRIPVPTPFDGDNHNPDLSHTSKPQHGLSSR